MRSGRRCSLWSRPRSLVRAVSGSCSTRCRSQAARRLHPHAKLPRVGPRYAHENIMPDGTRQIVIATDKPVSFGAALRAIGVDRLSVHPHRDADEARTSGRRQNAGAVSDHCQRRQTRARKLRQRAGSADEHYRRAKESEEVEAHEASRSLEPHSESQCGPFPCRSSAAALPRGGSASSSWARRGASRP